MLGFQPCNYFRNQAVGETYAGVGGTIIYGHFIAFDEGCAGEYHIGHIASKLIGSCGCEQVLHRAIQHAPRLILVQKAVKRI